MTLNTTVFPAIPKASVSTATKVNPGFLRSERKEKARSWKNRDNYRAFARLRVGVSRPADFDRMNLSSDQLQWKDDMLPLYAVQQQPAILITGYYRCSLRSNLEQSIEAPLYPLL